MRTYRSLDDALEAHANWVREQGVGPTSVEEIMAKIRRLVVGFTPPEDSTLLAASHGDLYYDCEADHLYCYTVPSKFLFEASLSPAGWSRVSEHAAQAGLPILEFYFGMAHTPTTAPPLTIQSLSRSNVGMGRFLINYAVEDLTLDVPYEPGSSHADLATCELVTALGNVLLRFYYPLDFATRYGKPLRASCRGNQVFFYPQPTPIVWKEFR